MMPHEPAGRDGGLQVAEQKKRGWSSLTLRLGATLIGLLLAVGLSVAIPLLQAKFEETDSELSRLEEQIQDLRDEVQDLKDRQDWAFRRIAHNESALGGTDRDVSTSELELSSLHQELRNLKRSLQDLMCELGLGRPLNALEELGQREYRSCTADLYGG
jgi:predicted RNase H-like nuclease (RuvC/YqgF family)